MMAIGEATIQGRLNNEDQESGFRSCGVGIGLHRHCSVGTHGSCGDGVVDRRFDELSDTAYVDLGCESQWVNHHGDQLRWRGHNCGGKSCSIRLE
jgi:hypothetical protein